jgi:hypothetical protein
MHTLARDLGMTVHELLEGEKVPLSTTEAHAWRVFYTMEAEDRKKQAAQRAAQRR